MKNQHEAHRKMNGFQLVEICLETQNVVLYKVSIVILRETILSMLRCRVYSCHVHCSQSSLWLCCFL